MFETLCYWNVDINKADIQIQILIVLQRLRKNPRIKNIII